MRPSAFDPPAIPPAFWERPDVCQALRQRDMSALFRLLQQYLGLSQMRIGTAVGLGQGRMSEVINGIRGIRDTHVFERIADGLDMPDHARVLLGLTPRQITAPPPRSPGRHLRPGRRVAPADHRGRAHRRHRRPRPAGRDRQHPAPGPPPRRPCRGGQAGSPHRPDRDQPAVLPAPRQPPAARPGPGRRLGPGRMAGHRHEPAAPRLGPLRARHRRRPRSRATPACSPSPPENRPTSCWTCTARPRPWPWSAPPTQETRTAIPHQVRSWLRAAEAEMAAAAGEESICRHALDGAAQEISHGAGQRGPAVPRAEREPSGPLARQLPGPVRRPADRRRPGRRPGRDGRRLHPRRSKPALRPGRRPARPRRVRRSQAATSRKPGNSPSSPDRPASAAASATCPGGSPKPPNGLASAAAATPPASRNSRSPRLRSAPAPTPAAPTPSAPPRSSRSAPRPSPDPAR